jgi:hypothetical protein
MAGADVLVLLQSISGPGCDVVSGKAYDYLAARKPILAVVADEGGDAWLLRETQSGLITNLVDPQNVAEGFLHFWRLWLKGELTLAASGGDIERFDRRHLARELADVFSQVLDEDDRARRTRAAAAGGSPPT